MQIRTLLLIITAIDSLAAAESRAATLDWSLTSNVSINAGPFIKLNAPSTNYATTWIKAGPISVASSSASIFEASSPTLEWLSLTLSTHQPGDLLDAMPIGNITMTPYNAATGQLILTGTDTLLDYLTVLESATYDNLAGGPQVASEWVGVVASDGNLAGNTAISTINIEVPAPEPSTLTLAALGFAAVVAWRWRRR